MSLPSNATISVRVRSISFEARDILSFDLRSIEGSLLPEFSAGSHIDIHLANGMIRSYSILNAQDERHRYVIAVHLDPSGRGGSKFVHENLRCGEVVRVSLPRNNFKLVETAKTTVLIAGGIGITPLLSMCHRLRVLERDWQLHYMFRSHDAAAFLDVLKEFEQVEGCASRIHLHSNASADESAAIIRAIVNKAHEDAHLYCCGPTGMTRCFNEAAASRPVDTVHVEYFSSAMPPVASADDSCFKVYLSRLCREVEVPADQSILATLLIAGLEVSYSCEQGVCGACETAVIEGEPDHRDMVLTDKQKAGNKTMMICCSRAKSKRLVLDI